MCACVRACLSVFLKPVWTQGGAVEERADVLCFAVLGGGASRRRISMRQV